MNPASVHVIRQALLHLIVDIREEPRQATKRCLDVSARTAEPVVQIQMPKGGVEVISVYQLDHPPPKPDALRVPGRTINGLRGLNKFLNFPLIVFGDVILVWGARLARLLLRTALTALGEGWSGRQR